MYTVVVIVAWITYLPAQLGFTSVHAGPKARPSMLDVALTIRTGVTATI